MSTVNGQYCSCGLHQGVGYFPNGTPLSAADRAARYKRLKERMPVYFTPMMKDYLEDFELHHGKVEYDMIEVGKSSGQFMAKGMPVMGPKARAQGQLGFGHTGKNQHWADA